MTSIWVELQEARKIIALLKKLKTWNLEESPNFGLYVITDKNGDVAYEAKSYDREHTVLYAVECCKTGEIPTVFGLQDFDPND